VSNVEEIFFGVPQNVTTQLAQGHVQLDIELAELVLHVRPLQPRQHRVIDQPWSAQPNYKRLILDAEPPPF